LTERKNILSGEEARKGINGRTALTAAAAGGRTEVVEILKRAGARE
jgi:hypothetical protein